MRIGIRWLPLMLALISPVIPSPVANNKSEFTAELERIKFALRSATDTNRFYHILGVGPHDDPNTIRRRYLKLSLLFHPDKTVGKANTNEDLTTIFQEINHANDILSNQEKRSRYDEEQQLSSRSSSPESNSRYSAAPNRRNDFNDQDSSDSSSEIDRTTAKTVLRWVSRSQTLRPIEKNYIIAALTGDVTRAKGILTASNSNILINGASGWDVAFLGAARGGNIGLVKILALTKSSKLDDALNLATMHGHADVVEFILNLDSSIDPTDALEAISVPEDRSESKNAIYSRLIGYVRENIYYILISVVENRKLSGLKFLLSLQCIAKERARALFANDNELIITAIMTRRVDIVRELLNSGVYANARNGKPLEIAVKMGSEPLVKLLLDFGAEPTAKSLSMAQSLENQNIYNLLAEIEIPGQDFFETLNSRSPFAASDADNEIPSYEEKTPNSADDDAIHLDDENTADHTENNLFGQVRNLYNSFFGKRARSEPLSDSTSSPKGLKKSFSAPTLNNLTFEEASSNIDDPFEEPRVLSVSVNSLQRSQSEPLFEMASLNEELNMVRPLSVETMHLSPSHGPTENVVNEDSTEEQDNGTVATPPASNIVPNVGTPPQHEKKTGYKRLIRSCCFSGRKI